MSLLSKDAIASATIHSRNILVKEKELEAAQDDYVKYLTTFTDANTETICIAQYFTPLESLLQDQFADLYAPKKLDDGSYACTFSKQEQEACCHKTFVICYFLDNSFYYYID